MKNYIVKVVSKLDNSEHKFPSLKDARNFIRSLINVSEVKGLEETYEVYKETISRKKIDEAKSSPNSTGSFEKIFG